MTFDIIVVGAGINGLITAYELSKQKDIRIAVIEEYVVGHSFGSSHGSSRISRSTYISPAYRDLMQRVNGKDFPELEEELGRQFLYPNSGCFFGSGKKFTEYVTAMKQSNMPVDILDIQEAKVLFPQFTFHDVSGVVHDRTGGIIAAQDLIKALKNKIIERGVQIFEGTKVLSIDSQCNRIKLLTNKQTFLADRLVITAGPKIGDLLPELHTKLEVIQQVIAFFALKGPQGLFQIPNFAQFAAIYDGQNEIYYGLPEFGSDLGVKVSQHIVHGDSSHFPKQSIDFERLQKLVAFVQSNFSYPIQKLVKADLCFYTNTKNEDFIIDFLPNDSRILIGSVCSGHGFKFAPLVGKILSELILSGRTTIPEFEKYRDTFKLDLQ